MRKLTGNKSFAPAHTLYDPAQCHLYIYIQYHDIIQCAHIQLYSALTYTALWGRGKILLIISPWILIIDFQNFEQNCRNCPKITKRDLNIWVVMGKEQENIQNTFWGVCDRNDWRQKNPLTKIFLCCKILKSLNKYIFATFSNFY